MYVQTGLLDFLSILKNQIHKKKEEKKSNSQNFMISLIFMNSLISS